MPLSNLAKRVLSAAVVLPIVLAVILAAPPWALAALVLVVTALGLGEIAAMTLPGEPAWHRRVTVGVGTLLAAGLYLAPSAAVMLVPLAIVTLGALIVARPGAIELAGPRLAAATLGVAYVGCLAPCLPLLARDVAAGPRWVVLVLLTTAANDTGAYFAGRALGRRKLHPIVSPGKTWEGAVGGLVAACAAVFAMAHMGLLHLSPLDVVAVAVPASVLGPFGDLMESLLKRSAGVKDSGNVLPGHGGILDRLDAMLFVGAWVYAYASHLR